MQTKGIPGGRRKFWNRAAALLVAAAVAAVSYTVTVLAWFQDSLNTSAQIAAGYSGHRNEYDALVERHRGYYLF